MGFRSMLRILSLAVRLDRVYGAVRQLSIPMLVRVGGG